MKSRRINDKIIALILGVSLGLLLILIIWNNKQQESLRFEGQTQTGNNEAERGSEIESASGLGTESETEIPPIVLNENPLTGEFTLTDGAV